MLVSATVRRDIRERTTRLMRIVQRIVKERLIHSVPLHRFSPITEHVRSLRRNTVMINVVVLEVPIKQRPEYAHALGPKINLISVMQLVRLPKHHFGSIAQVSAMLNLLMALREL